MQGATNLHFHFNRLQPVLTLCQGQDFTAVMPANFEANVSPTPTIAPPTSSSSSSSDPIVDAAAAAVVAMTAGSAAAVPSASTTYKFLFPEKQFMAKAVRRAKKEQKKGDAAANAAGEARKMRKLVAAGLKLDKPDAYHVECVAFSMFMSDRQQQVRCFLVKVEHEVPLPAAFALTLNSISFLMVDTQLCAMQMLLNKNVSFPTAAPVTFDQIGKAFIEILKPEMFSQSNYNPRAGHPKEHFIDVLIYILRNIFSHMREPEFRHAITGGGILKATKLWLREDSIEPHDDLNLGFWRQFDIAEYILHGSLFGHVFPLCYRLIRTKLRGGHGLPPRYTEMLLQCIPAAHFDFEIPSSLDWCVDAAFCSAILKYRAQVFRPRGCGALAQVTDGHKQRDAAEQDTGRRKLQSFPARRQTWPTQARH